MSKLVAKEVRNIIKNKGLKASSVRSDHDSVRVQFTDIPYSSAEAVKTECNKFMYGHFDGMNDIYEYSNSRDDIPQTRWMFIDVDYSDAVREDVLKVLVQEISVLNELPDVYQDYNNARNMWIDEYSARVDTLIRRFLTGALQLTTTVEEFWSNRK